MKIQIENGIQTPYFSEQKISLIKCCLFDTVIYSLLYQTAIFTKYVYVSVLKHKNYYII